MRPRGTAFVVLTSTLALLGCEDTVFAPLYSPETAGGSVLTVRGTVTSAMSGEPVSGATVRVYAAGRPFAFPYTAAHTSTTEGGSYVLQLPVSFGNADNCLAWRLSARANGFVPQGDVVGVVCSTGAQEFDFTLDPFSRR